MIISTRGHYDDTSTRVDVTWDQLVEWLKSCAGSEAKEKEQIRLFSFADFDGKKSLTDVTSISGALLDLDSISEEQARHTLAWAHRYQGFAYTSHGHGVKNGYRMRIGIRIDRDVTPQLWVAFWERLQATIATESGTFIDSKCKDPSRCYYVPCTNPAAPSPCWFDAWDGPVLSVEDILQSTAVIPEELELIDESEAGELIGYGHLADLAGKMQRRKGDHVNMIGRCLETALSGKAFAVKGHHDTLSFQLAGAIADAFPHGNPEAIANLLQVSLESQGWPTVDKFRKMISRHQAARQKHLREVAEMKMFSGAGPSPAPADGEGEIPTAPAPVVLGGPLIVQKAGFFWVRDHENLDYKEAYHYRDIHLALIRKFPGYMLSGSGALPLEQALQTYSVPALSVIGSYTAEGNKFDIEKKELTLSRGRLRPVDGAFSPDIDRWLKALAGVEYSHLKAWLRGLTRLDKPSPALYLHGPSGTGKTFFATCVASLWTATPVAMAELVGGFTGGLSRCPIVHADEGLPAGVTLDYLRNFLTTGRRAINPKYEAPYELVGHIRLIVSANNFEVVSSSKWESLTADDAAAVAARFMPIRTPLTAATVLENVNTHDLLRDFAAHVAWLVESEGPVETKGRFVAQGAGDELAARIAGVRYETFIHGVASYLQNPLDTERRYSGGATDAWWIRTKGGGLWVASTVGPLCDAWGIDGYVARRAIAFFMLGDRKSRRKMSVPGGGGRALWYHQIDIAKVMAALGEDVDAYHSTLAVDTEVRTGNSLDESLKSN